MCNCNFLIIKNFLEVIEVLESIIYFLLFFLRILLDKAGYFLVFIEMNILCNASLSLYHVYSLCSIYLTLKIRVKQLNFVPGINEKELCKVFFSFLIALFFSFFFFLTLFEILQIDFLYLYAVDIPDFLE